MQIVSALSPAEALRAQDEAPAVQLEQLFSRQIENAIHAVRSGLQTYESLRNVNEVVGGEYGDRVIFELVQNAHDAHAEGHDGEIMLRLVVKSDGLGDLYVANGGNGFDWGNVAAIRNVAVSSKSVGDGIGNKGLGFRSVETLTDDPRIYSQRVARLAPSFDGFCFRFASADEVRGRMPVSTEPPVRDLVAATLPRYLAAVPVVEQDETIQEFAKRGYATVIHLPLRTEAAVTIARDQIMALLDPGAPLLLFLDRLRRVAIEIDVEGSRPICEVLTRTIAERPQAGRPSRNSYEVTVLQPGAQRFLLVRRKLDRTALLNAVEQSIRREAQLARWRDWSGDPTVAVAVPLASTDSVLGRIYNFLPMTSESKSPLRGHVDAPFYASIDRRRANFDLPLNAFLLDRLAETSAGAAVDLKEAGASIDRYLIFDLMAWDPSDAGRLMLGERSPTRSWPDLALVPAAGEESSWTSVRGAVVWDEAGYRQFRATRLVRAGIGNIADPSMGSDRLFTLERLIRAVGRQAAPDGELLAQWAEALADLLQREGAGVRAWSSFYEELRRACKTITALRAARNRRILRTRGGGLASASAGGAGDTAPPVYVRLDHFGRRKESSRAPSPPPALARKFNLFDEDVLLKPEIAADFMKAGLCRRYDAVELLSGIAATFTDKPAPARREAALVWAFEVWKSEPQRAGGIVRTLDLHVETRAGWTPAGQACFSEGWTQTGRLLDTYLTEASALSPTCREARETLLVSDSTWTPKADALRRDWVRFLTAAGVNHGLTPVATAGVQLSGGPNWIWYPLLRTEGEAGRDARWTALTRNISLYNPNTNYRRKGELWMFPGQVECSGFAADTRSRLAELVLVHLAQKGVARLSFSLGRYDRAERDWQEVRVPTPAAAFVASADWIPLAEDPERFFPPAAVWSTSDGRQRPRFVRSVQERLAAQIEDDEALRTLLMGPAAGMRDWTAAERSAEKLDDLAHASVGLEPRDRAAFRRVYQRAWSQAIEVGTTLPGDLSVAASTQDGWQVVRGGAARGKVLYVAADLQRPEVRALLGAGQSVLDVGEEHLVLSALAMLANGGGFDAKPVGQEDVALVVDGRPFAPDLADPLLLAGGLEWLVDAALLANEILGRELERQISATNVEQRLRRVRLRLCETIELRVGGAAAGDAMSVYAYDDATLPTLLAVGTQAVTWTVLADAASALSCILDRRMRSFETLLLRLAARCSAGPEERPDDDALAQALRCRVQVVREYADERRGSGERLLRLLVPAVACLSDLASAMDLRARLAGMGGARIGARGLLNGLSLPVDTDELLDLVWEVGDLAELRCRLGIDFGYLNAMLVALGEEPLSNEPELRRLFEVWKEDLMPSAVDRLRRWYWADHAAGNTLAQYVAERTLAFVAFDDRWIVEREDLDRETVRERIAEAIGNLHGPDLELEVPDLHVVRARNRRTVQKAVEDSAPTVRAWLHRHTRPEGVWAEGALAVAKLIDQFGLLDFAEIRAAEAIDVFARVGAWPSGMAQSIDPAVVGLDAGDMLGGARRLDETWENRARELRTVRFAGESLDTGAPGFAERLAALIDDALADGSWLKRSRRRFDLAKISKPEPRPRGAGAGVQGGRRRHRPTEAMRTAMGLASEYLVRRWLEERFRSKYTNASWVSRNREDVTTTGDGNDAAGFDFRIRLVEHEWLYEVKSSLDDRYEFEFTQNEMRVAASVSKDTKQRYRILFVPFVFEPERWRIMELPNPMTDAGRRLFMPIGVGSTRFRFDPQQ